MHTQTDTRGKRRWVRAALLRSYARANFHPGWSERIGTVDCAQIVPQAQPASRTFSLPHETSSWRGSRFVVVISSNSSSYHFLEKAQALFVGPLGVQTSPTG
jgi:hypothetical protein